MEHGASGVYALALFLVLYLACGATRNAQRMELKAQGLMLKD